MGIPNFFFLGLPVIEFDPNLLEIPDPALAEEEEVPNSDLDEQEEVLDPDHPGEQEFPNPALAEGEQPSYSMIVSSPLLEAVKDKNFALVKTHCATTDTEGLASALVVLVTHPDNDRILFSIFKYLLKRLEEQGKDEEVLLRFFPNQHEGEIQNLSILQLTVLNQDFGHKLILSNILFDYLDKKPQAFKDKFLNLQDPHTHRTALMMACKGHYEEVIVGLLKLGANMSIKDKNGCDIIYNLIYASSFLVDHHYDRDVVTHERFLLRLLLNRGAYLEVGQMQEYKQGLLSMSTYANTNANWNCGNNLDVISAAFHLLIFADKPGFDYEEDGTGEFQPLAEDADTERLVPAPTFKSFTDSLKKGLNARRSSDGNSALHLAIIRNKPRLVTLLLNAGARTDLTNNDGLTPRQLGVQSQNRYIRSLFYVRSLRKDFGVETETQEWLKVYEDFPLVDDDVESKERQDESEGKEQAEVQRSVGTKTLVEDPSVRFYSQRIAREIFGARWFIERTLKSLEGFQKDQLSFEWGCFLAEHETPFFDPVRSYHLLNEVPKTHEQQYKLAHATQFKLLMGKFLVIKQDPESLSEGEYLIERRDPAVIPELDTVFSPEMLYAEIRHYLYSGLKDEMALDKLLAQYWTGDLSGKPTTMTSLTASTELPSVKGFCGQDPDSFLVLIREGRAAHLKAQSTSQTHLGVLSPSQAPQDSKSIAEIDQLKANNQRLTKENQHQALELAQLRAKLANLEKPTAPIGSFSQPVAYQFQSSTPPASNNRKRKLDSGSEKSGHGKDLKKSH